MDDEIDGPVLSEIRIIQYIGPDGREIVAARHDGEASLVTRLGMLDLTRDTFLREDGADE